MTAPLRATPTALSRNDTTTRPRALASAPPRATEHTGRMRPPAPRGTPSGLLTLLLIAVDLLVISLTALAAVLLRGNLSVFQPTGDVAENVGPVALLLVGLWMLTLFVGGAYRTKRTGVGTNEYTVVLVWSLIAAGVIAITLYLTSYNLSRGFFVLLFGMGIPLLIVGRYLLRRVLKRARSGGRLSSAVLIAGSPSHIDRIAGVLARERWLGYEVVGALVPGEPAAQTDGGIPIVGRPADAVEALQHYGAQAVIFAEGSFAKAHQFNEMAREFEDFDAQLIVVPTLTDISAERVAVRPVAGLPLVYVEQPRASRARSWAERAFDVVGSSLLILVSLPIMLIVAIAIRIEDHGPALFRQRRIGLGGQEFGCLKFRSMTQDAEAHVAELERRNEGAGVLFKVKDDPRVTRVGHFIRRFSLDELPQFFNVFAGQMSLVGPRPALPGEVARYEKHVLRRLDVRPGITGLWQVSGRSDLSWEDTVRLDLYYVDNWSMLADLHIIARTLGAVLRSRGAY